MTAQIGRRFVPIAALLVSMNLASAQQPDPGQSQPMRRIPERAGLSKASLQGTVRDEDVRAVPAAVLTIRSLLDGTSYQATTDVEGTFRIRDVPLGVYELKAVRDGYESLVIDRVQVSSPGLVVLGLQMKRVNPIVPATKGVSGIPGNAQTLTGPEAPSSPYPGLRTPSAETTVAPAAELLPPASANFEIDADRWNGLILERPDGELAQGWEWGEVQDEAGFTPHRYAVLAGSSCIAAVSLTCRQLPGLPHSILYASRGPLLDWQDERAWSGILPVIRRVAERHRAIFLRVSPAVPHDDLGVRVALARHGFRPIPDDWTTWNAPRLVLTQSLHGDAADLRERFRKGTRRDLAAAQRRGARVRVARDRADLLAFHRMTVAAGREKGYPVRPLARLEALWRAYVAGGDGVLLLAEHEGALLGGVLGLRFGRRAHLHRATILRRGEGQQLHQGPLLYWKLIRWAKTVGCDEID